MNTLLARLTAWYAALAPRERLTVSLGGAAAALILLVAGVLTLQQSVSRSRERVDQKQRDLAFVQAAAAEILAAGPIRPTGGNGESLVVIADRATRQAGLVAALTGSEAGADGSLRTSFRGVAFDAFAGLLASLDTQSSIAVQSAEIESTGEPGKVNATVVLRPATTPTT